MVTGFMKQENCGRQKRDRAYPPSGFLNKKGVHPDNAVSKNNLNPFKKYPWPVIRLAELYLGYA
ncbi:MAG: RagB/SusD family nutrient uptake outer membrane protein [Tannerellaceae bacterium]